MRNENLRVVEALAMIYALCAAVMGALCLVLYPLIEFSWWRVTGLFGLVMMAILGVAFRNVYRRRR